MPTIKEIIAKREELKATNPNATNVDARKSLMQAPQTGNAPVAGVAPAITPTAPTPTPVNVNEQQRIDNQTKRQEMIAQGQVPAVGQTPAPVTPTPVTPEPVAPTPTQTTPTTTTPVDKNEEIKAKNEAQMALNKQQADLRDQERQKVAQETAIANTPTDMQGILQSMVSGMPVAPQKTGNYINAKFQYEQFNRFNSMTPTQLLDNLKQGQIGTEMDRLLSQNPNYAQAKAELDKVQKTNSINNNIKNIYGGVTGTTAETPDYLTKVSDDLIKKLGLDQDMTTAEAFSQYVEGDQKIVDYTNQLSSTNRQIADTSKLISDGIKSLKAQKGDMPADALITLMNSTFRDANETLTNLNNTKQYLEADLKMATEMAYNRFGAVSKDIENTRNIKNSVISNLIQSQFSMAGKIQEAEMANQIAREAMNDPYKAIPQMIEEYKKLGIPFTRSTQQIIQDFESSGQDLGTYLTELQKLVQEKPEYQAYTNKLTGAEWQSANITRYNPATGANESTPIFYRKKTSGGFEAVDLSGNPIDVSNLTAGAGGTSGAPGTLPTSFTGDTASYIASKEGFRDTAYQDSGGVWTIGYGTTKINGKAVQPGQKITQEQAQALLNEDIAKHSNWKNYIDESTLSDSQKTALASFEYNLGPGIWDKGAVNIINMIKSGDLAGAGREMKKYNTVKGTVVNGLTNRRNEEASLLMNTGTSTTGKTFTPLQTKEFESYDGKTIPAQYKTPLEQDQFVRDYNEWRSNAISNPIKTGEDILKIQLSDKATEQEKNAIQYGSRMLNAINDLGPLEEIYLKLPLKDQIYQEYTPNLLKSDNQKILDSRKKDFITAVLRKESGASIAASEFANEEKKYFAQPGDSPSVIAKKQNARNFAIKAILSAAGKDINGKLVASLYNPEAITANSSDSIDLDSRLKALRAKTKQ